MTSISSQSSPTRGKMAGWVMITGGAQIVRVIVTLLSAAILARLLSPTDFGLIAAAAPILSFTSMLQNLGLNEALIQRPNLQKGHINALFLIMTAASVVIALLLVLAAPLLAGVLNEPRLTGIIQANAVIALIVAATSTPGGLLNRQLKFRQLAAVDVAASVIGLTVGIVMALTTRSYWALVWMQGVTWAVQLVGTFAFAGWRPGKPQFDSELKQMIGLGTGFTSFNLLNFLSKNADMLLLARFSGATALGYYERAYKLMLAPLWQATAPFHRVLTPVLARLQSDPVAYRERYFEATSFLMAAVQPGVVAALVFSNLTVTVVLGPGWEPSGPIFFWLGLTVLHQIQTLTISWLFVSQGRGGELAVVGAVTAGVAVASFIIGLPYGPLGVATCYAIGDFSLRAPFTWWCVGRKGPVDLGFLVSGFAPHALAMMAAAAALFAMSETWIVDDFFGLAGAACLSYIVYGCVLAAFREKRKLAVAFIRGAVRKIRVRTS